MRNFIFLLFAAALCISCNEYGNKITIAKKNEVYYKGDGVKEDDAKRLGDFLLKQGYFDSTSARSVQLTKDSATWIVKLVVDEEKLKGNATEVVMWMGILEMLMKEEVFAGADTRIELVDTTMSDIKNDSLRRPNIDDDSIPDVTTDSVTQN